MKTLKVENEEEENSTTTSTTVDPSSKKTTVSIPIEIIEEILSRLPVKSILRFTAVSKAWLSLISHPSFPTLQLTHATSAFFLYAYDTSTNKRHYLSAASYGGPLNLLPTVDTDNKFDNPSHLNGLVCFTSRTWAPEPYPRLMNLTPVFINPSTRKLFKLPPITLPDEFELFGHLYGFDESTNQHKILLTNTLAREFMVFDMSSRSWRKIEAEPPVGFTWDNIRKYLDVGVCFDSKVHVMLPSTQMFEILAFDFVTEKFSLISIPQDTQELGTLNNRPFIVKINGCLGVVVYAYARFEIHIWLLHDYQNGVWVKETITLPEPWKALACEFFLSIDANMDDEIVFNISKVYENVMSVLVYDMKSKSFKSLEFTLDGQVLSSENVRFNHIMHYVDSMVPV